MNYILEFVKNPSVPNEVTVHGVDMGNGSKPIYVHKSHPHDLSTLPVGLVVSDEFFEPIIVLKEPGGMHWAGRGESFKYHGAQFKVLKLTKVEEVDGHRYYHCEELIEIPVRTKDG